MQVMALKKVRTLMVFIDLLNVFIKIYPIPGQAHLHRHPLIAAIAPPSPP
jgi:hypothetical protein